MTVRDAAALATFAVQHRKLLRTIVQELLGRPPDEDQALPPRAAGGSLVAWACHCRNQQAGAADLTIDVNDAYRLADAQLAHAEAHGLVALALDDDRYPPLLRAIPDPPVILWCRGEPVHLTRPGIALVGSRAATPHGLEIAARLAADLARAGLIIVSGLARGVDSAAHASALAAGGTTVAVLGCGPDRVYPAEHAGLARNIQNAGVLVSEFPPSTPPLQHHFPLRNRIISGLSHAVVVVEAPEKSGSLITAASAVEQGRDVLVVPGHAIGARNRGGHLLIRDGAKLVETTDDILQEVGRPPASGCGSSAVDPDNLPDGVDFTVDDVAARTGMGPSLVLARLLDLELAGRIQRIGGGRFVRSRNRVLP
jgi:DNA processing protein